MLRQFIKGVAEACRWRWLDMEALLDGRIHNVTIRTIVTALWFAVRFVIRDILFGWLGFLIAFTTKKGKRLLEDLVDDNIEKFGLVLSWEEEF